VIVLFDVKKYGKQQPRPTHASIAKASYHCFFSQICIHDNGAMLELQGVPDLQDQVDPMQVPWHLLVARKSSCLEGREEKTLSRISRIKQLQRKYN